MLTASVLCQRIIVGVPAREVPAGEDSYFENSSQRRSLLGFPAGGREAPAGEEGYFGVPAKETDYFESSIQGRGLFEFQLGGDGFQLGRRVTWGLQQGRGLFREAQPGENVICHGICGPFRGDGVQ